MYINPQKWPDCAPEVKLYIERFVALLKDHLPDNLTGIYLHGSLATGSFYPPKSDIDIIAVVPDKIAPKQANPLAQAVARYSAGRPITGDIEFSIITAETAANPPFPAPYELHYSSDWRERILNDEVTYGVDQFDPDLAAHLTVLKIRGGSLYGKPVEDVFGNVPQQDFMASIMEDLSWILDRENILESPFYCILNICRVMQLLATGEHYPHSKDEGAQWALAHLPSEFQPLIRQALEVYHFPAPVSESERRTGGTLWDRDQLLTFRDYARSTTGFTAQ